MSTLFTLDLTINMADTDRHTRQLLNLYFPDMTTDIDEIALQMCDAKPDVKARKFGNLTLKRADAWAGEQGGLKIFALLSVSSEGPAFIKQVIAEYMGSFPSYLKKASGRYFSRTTFPPGISLQPTDWNVVVQ